MCTSLLRVTICCVFSILESKILPLEFVACFIELGTTGTSQFQVKVIMQLITNECNTLYSTTIKSKLQNVIVTYPRNSNNFFATFYKI